VVLTKQKVIFDGITELMNDRTWEGLVDVDKMLVELRLEREQIEEAILTLERLARGRGRRRGRPPAWLKNAGVTGETPVTKEYDASPAPTEPRRRGRPPGSKTKHLAQNSEI
jgi:hypothetical protein